MKVTLNRTLSVRQQLSHRASKRSGGLDRSVEVIWFMQCKFWARSRVPGTGLSICFMAIYFQAAILVFIPSYSSDCIIATYANTKMTWIFSSKLINLIHILFYLYVFLKTAEIFFFFLRKEHMYKLYIGEKHLILFIIAVLCAWHMVGLQKM